jgi:hypothetical protein
MADHDEPVAPRHGATVEATLERLMVEGVIGPSSADTRPVACGRARPRSRRPVSDLLCEQRIGWLGAGEVHDEPGAEVVESRVDLGLPVAVQLRSPRGSGQLSEPMPQVPGAVPRHVPEREQCQSWAVRADGVG